MLNFTNIIAILGGGTLIIATVVGAAWWIFQTFSGKWLDSRFNERLEAYKLAGAVEIARVQFSIDAKLDRATKLHAHEFDVLPKAFDMLCSTAGAVNALIEKDPKYPDLSQATDHELDALLEETPLSDHDKAEIRANKGFSLQPTYIKVKRRHLMTTAVAETQTLHNYLASKSIFIQPDLREKFLKASRLLSNTVDNHAKGSATPSPFYQLASGIDPLSRNRQTFKAINPLIEDIGQSISNRLWGRTED